MVYLKVHIHFHSASELTTCTSLQLQTYSLLIKESKCTVNCYTNF